jgi:hypothetical protein
MAERYADDKASLEALRAIAGVAADASHEHVQVPRDDFDIVVAFAFQAAEFAACEDIRTFAAGCSNQVAATIFRESLGDDDIGAANKATCESQLNLLRDLIGNPFRPVSIDTAWLTPTVCRLATIGYEERSLPSGELDTARLAVLADALEDAGCQDADMLTHLRGPGPHVRGCWALDLLLGKE